MRGREVGEREGGRKRERDRDRDRESTLATWQFFKCA